MPGYGKFWRTLLAGLALATLCAAPGGAWEPVEGRRRAGVVGPADLERPADVGRLRALHRPTDTRPVPDTRSVPPRKPVVVIDPGHGGSERGMAVGRLEEKEYTLDIGFRRMAAQLDPAEARLVFTRTGDQTVGLSERAHMANAAGADLLVSVHVNWWTNPRSRGVETYYKGGAEAAPAVMERSRRLGCLIHRRVLAAYRQLGDKRCPGTDRGVISRLLPADDGRTYYRVLREAEMPAVLVELGYLSHDGERACLALPGFRDALAAAIAAGIDDYLSTDVPADDCPFQTAYGL